MGTERRKLSSKQKREILLCVLAMIALVSSAYFVLLYYAMREATQVSCSGNLATIAQLLHSYRESNGTLPPAVVYSEDGHPLYSWRLLIARYDNPDMYSGFNMSEPWDSTNNLKYVNEMPPFFFCGNETNEMADGNTSYVALLSNDNLSENANECSIKLLLIVEVADSNIPWTKPQDLSVRELSGVNDFSKSSIRSHDPGGPAVIWFDFSRQRISKDDEDAFNEYLKQFGKAFKPPADINTN